MAENKQYICQTNENGQIFISEDVIATIAYHALSEVEGFAGLTTKASMDFTVPLNPRHWNRAVKVNFTEKGSLLLEISALAAYGANLVNLSRSIQTAVSDAISSITGVQPKRVNVNIYGVVRK